MGICPVRMYTTATYLCITFVALLVALLNDVCNALWNSSVYTFVALLLHFWIATHFCINTCTLMPLNVPHIWLLAMIHIQRKFWTDWNTECMAVDQPMFVRYVSVCFIVLERPWDWCDKSVMLLFIVFTPKTVLEYIFDDRSTGTVIKELTAY